MLFIDAHAKKPVLSPPHEILYGDGSYSLSHHQSMHKYDSMFDAVGDIGGKRKEPYECPFCFVIRNQIVPTVGLSVEHENLTRTKARVLKFCFHKNGAFGDGFNVSRVHKQTSKFNFVSSYVYLGIFHFHCRICHELPCLPALKCATKTIC